MVSANGRELAGRTVSAVSLGCMNLSHAYGNPPAESDAIRLLNLALDLGVTMLDTAALYGSGANEELIGRALQNRRDEYMLASKCGFSISGRQRIIDGSPAGIARTLDEALARLRTDRIDLYYMHRPDPQVPIEESVGALARAKAAGKIGAIGLSEISAATLRRAHAEHSIAAVQSEYSPASRNPEAGMLDTCRDLGVAFVAFSPLCRGLLAGRIRNADYERGDIRRFMPRFVEPQLSANLAIVAKFDQIAAEAGVTAAQLCFHWLLSRDSAVIALPGTMSEAHLRENVAAMYQRIDPAVLSAVDKLFPPNALAGARYAKEAQAQVETELLPDEELA